MDFQRFFLFIALAFVLLLIWQAWLEEQRPPAPEAGTTPGEQAQTERRADADAAAPGDAGDVPDAPQVTAGEEGDRAAPDEGAAVPESPGAPAADAGQRISIETDLIAAEIGLQGGDLRRVALKQHPVSVERPDVAFALMHDSGDEVFYAQTGLIGTEGDYPNHRKRYQSERSRYELDANEDELIVDLKWEGPDGVSYTKRYTFHRNSYRVHIDYLVHNTGAGEWRGFLYAQFVRTRHEPERGWFMQAVPSYTGGAIWTPEDKYQKIDFDDMAETPLQREVTRGWVAMLQHYFVGAWLPQGEGPYRFYSRALDGPRYNIGYTTLTPTTVPAGARGRLATSVFVGPKEQDRLKEQSEGLVLTVDYGWLTPISAPLFWVLERIHAVVANWGWSIVLLTLFIKLAFYPLSAASYKSMARMKKLGPRLQTLRERYKDDRQKLNQAMMEMYKKDKINPLGGCLPIAVQIPVFIALYWVLLESVELRQADFVLWIHDLSQPDPYFVLPILMGASMLGQHFLNPAPVDPMQKRIMMALPIVFTFFFLFFPAGLVLYWLVNNVLSIAQQWYVNNRVIAKDS